jgi:hypothetical protein
VTYTFYVREQDMIQKAGSPTIAPPAASNATTPPAASNATTPPAASNATAPPAASNATAPPAASNAINEGENLTEKMFCWISATSEKIRLDLALTPSSLCTKNALKQPDCESAAPSDKVISRSSAWGGQFKTCTIYSPGEYIVVLTLQEPDLQLWPYQLVCKSLTQPPAPLPAQPTKPAAGPQVVSSSSTEHSQPKSANTNESGKKKKTSQMTLAKAGFKNPCDETVSKCESAYWVLTMTEKCSELERGKKGKVQGKPFEVMEIAPCTLKVQDPNETTHWSSTLTLLPD